MKEVNIVRWEATDGQVFNSKIECEAHERYLGKEDIWIVIPRAQNRIEEKLEVYSSIELAKRSLRFIDSSNRGSYKIVKFKIDGMER